MGKQAVFSFFLFHDGRSSFSINHTSEEMLDHKKYFYENIMNSKLPNKNIYKKTRCIFSFINFKWKSLINIFIYFFFILKKIGQNGGASR